MAFDHIHGFLGGDPIDQPGSIFLVQATFCSGESSRDSFSCGVSALAQLLGRVTWCCLFKGMVNDHRRFVALFWGPMSEMSLKCCEAGSSEFFWIRDTGPQYHRTQKDIKLRYVDWWSPKNHGRKLRPRLKAWPLTFSHISHRLPWLLCVTGGSADDTDSTSLCRVAPVWSARKQVSPLCSGPGGGQWVRSVHLSVFETEHESRGTRRPLPFDVSSSVSHMWYVLWSGTSDPLNASQLCSVIHSKIHCDHDVFWSFLCEGSLICYLTAPAHKIYVYAVWLLQRRSWCLGRGLLFDARKQPGTQLEDSFPEGYSVPESANSSPLRDGTSHTLSGMDFLAWDVLPCALTHELLRFLLCHRLSSFPFSC